MTKDWECPEKLLPFINSTKRYNLAEGGRLGAKSNFMVMLMLVKGASEKTGLLFAREVQKSLGDSVFSLCCRLIDEHNMPYGYNKTSIWGYNGTKVSFVGISGVTEQSVKSLDGFKYCFVEEAQALSQSSWDILEPTLRVEENQFFFAMNRLKIKDPIYNHCVNIEPEETLHVNIQYYDNPWITERQLATIENMKSKDYARFEHIYLGKPLESLERSILSLRDVEDSYKRNIVSPEGAIEWGCDVARFGDDRTVIVSRKGLKLLTCDVFTKLPTDKRSDILMNKAKKGELIKVDDTGVGGGVTDILRRNGYFVHAVNFGTEAQDKDKYSNTISEMWFNFQEIIKEVDLKEMQGLTEELAYRQWDMDKKGRRMVESKDAFKKEFKRSSDLADGILLAFYNKKVRSWKGL